MMRSGPNRSDLGRAAALSRPYHRISTSSNLLSLPAQPFNMNHRENYGNEQVEMSGLSSGLEDTMEEYRDEYEGEVHVVSPRRASCRLKRQNHMLCGLASLVFFLAMVIVFLNEQDSGDAVPAGQPSVSGPQYTKGCVFKDRFDNENNYQHNKLYPGQYICSTNHTNDSEQHHRYRFGVSTEGDLVLQDTMYPESDTYTYNRTLMYRNPNIPVVENTKCYFSLQINGTFVMHHGQQHSSGTVAPNREMHLHEQCLKEHDCPYIHLHADGVLVINYIDGNNKWQAKNGLRVYSF